MIGIIKGHTGIIFPLILAWLVFVIPAILGSRKEKFASLFTVLAAMPFLFLFGSGERFLYIPSMGGVFFISILVCRFRPKARFIIASSLALYLAVFSLANQKRWLLASRQSGMIVNFLKRIEKRMESGSRIIFINPPEDVDGAWVFKNGLEYVDDLYFERDIEIVAVKGRIDQINHRDHVILWEVDSTLLPLKMRNDGGGDGSERD